jgi:trimeric autotransporter adhesin
MKKNILISLTLLLCIDSYAQQLDPTWWQPNGTVRAIVKDGNTVYVGGDFTFIGQQAQFGVPIDATSGTPVISFSRPNGEVKAVIPDGSGGWYIGGAFTQIGGLTRNRLAHINSSGQVTNWNPNSDGAVNALVKGGDTIFAGGSFTNIGGNSRLRLAAINAITGITFSWTPNPNGSVNTLLLNSGILYVGGLFSDIGLQFRNRIAALDASTGVATSWNPNASTAVGHSVNALAVSGSVVYAGGSYTAIGGQSRNRIAALDISTGLATAWNPNISTAGSSVNALAVSGNIVYVGGSFTAIGLLTRNRIAALDATINTNNGTAWNPGADSEIKSLAINGLTLYVGGSFSSIGGQLRNRLAALNTSINTNNATSWNPDANNTVSVVAVSGSMVYAGGIFTTIGGVSRSRIAAFNATTGIPTSWNPGADNRVNTLVLNGSTIYAGGMFTSIGGLTRSRIGAVDIVTGIATSWDPTAQNSVNCLRISGSTVYVGGGFTFVGGQSRNNIAAVDITSGLASSWNPDANGIINAIEISGSLIYVGGAFTNIGGQTRNRIAALNQSIGNSTAWDPNSSGTINTIAINGTTIYAGGAFSAIGGQSRNNIAALNANVNTSNAFSWNPFSDNTVNALYFNSDLVYAAGAFTFIGGQFRNGLASLSAFNNSGSAATSWNPNAGATPVAILALNNVVYTGGSFSTIGGQIRANFAKFDDVNITTNTNWSSITTGEGPNGQPNCSDDIIISGNAILTVDVNDAQCANININRYDDNTTGQLKFNSGSQLAVCGSVGVGYTLATSRNGILDMANGGILKIGGLLNLSPGVSTFIPGSGVVEYNSTVAQTVTTTTYNHLVISGSGTKSTFGNISLNGDLTINSGSTLDVSTNISGINISGNWHNDGIFIPGSSTATFSGATAISGTADHSFYDISVTGTLTLFAGLMRVSGNWNNSGTVNHNNGTVSFHTTVFNAIQTVNAGGSAFNNIEHGFGTMQLTNNLVTSGTFVNSGEAFNANGFANTVAGLTSLFSNIYTAGTGVQTFNGGLTISSGTFNGGSNSIVNATNITLTGGTLTAPGSSGSFNVSGNWSRAGTFNHNNGTVVFNGTGPQNIGGSLPTTFNNLTIAGSSGKTLTQNITVNNILSLSRIINTGLNSITSSSGGSITGASSSAFIDGILSRVFSATGSKAFPIGKAGIYRPLSVNYTALTGTSTVTAEQFENVMTGALSPFTVFLENRYWKVTQTGGSNLNYDITLDPGGVSPVGTVLIAKKDGSTIVEIPANTPDFTAQNLNSFSDFALVDRTCTKPVITTEPVGVTKCQGQATTFSVNASGTATLNYQWRKNGINIGTNASTYNIPSISTSDAGNYDVIISNFCGGDTSLAVALNVSQNANAGTVSGTTPICNGATASYSSNGNAGGNWSSSNISVATVNTTSGLVTAVSNGTANIIYTVSTGCNNPVVAFSVINVITCSVTLNLKLFIEGFYTGGGMMDNFGTGGNLFLTGNSNNSSDVDSVFISVVNPVSLAVIETKAGILQVNGNVSVNFTSNVSENASFYLRIDHRNAIQTWSSLPVVMSSNTFYDFTLAPSKAYGNNMVQTFDQAGWAFYSGDISDAALGIGFQDGVIESQDYGDMENAVSIILTGYVTQDITGDGVVESTDYSIMENNVRSIIFAMRP